MSDNPQFQTASEAAESWLNTVAMIADLGQAGNVDTAMQLLLPTDDDIRGNLQDSYAKFANVIIESQEKLRAVSDGKVKWEHGRGLSAVARVPAVVYPHVWSSAHEAAVGIAGLALRLLADPLDGITDPAEQWETAKGLLADRAKALAMTLDEVAELQERIRRERAKLLSGYAPRLERLHVDLEAKTLTLDGTTYPVNSELALRWVKVLADHANHWITAGKLRDYDQELDGCRPDRFKKSLPQKIQDLIDPKSGAGYRIRL